MTVDIDKTVIAILRERDGQPTTVHLTESRTALVFNIAWGYDEGDEFAHITTNISPSIDGEAMDVFFTREVVRIEDSNNGVVLFER
jgi:hypothetical protein